MYDEYLNMMKKIPHISATHVTPHIIIGVSFNAYIQCHMTCEFVSDSNECGCLRCDIDIS